MSSGMDSRNFTGESVASPQATRTEPPMTQAEYEVEYDKLLKRYNETFPNRAAQPAAGTTPPFRIDENGGKHYLDNDLTPEEAIGIAHGLRDLAEGKTKSLEQIQRELESDGTTPQAERPAPTKITLENCGPENLEFNAEWGLVSANRVAWTGKPYARKGEALITANVGAWYETACYWREEAEKLARAVAPVETPDDTQDVKTFWPYELIRSAYEPTLIRLITDNCTPKQAADGLRSIADWLLEDR